MLIGENRYTIGREGPIKPMNVIRILPEKVASQIAAGEVIERPASVVRELLDNSIDAGSTTVFLRIENGGKRLIRVRDNGVGMSRDDLLLCLERHATSKIKSVSDLFSLSSLGFRGEALPSTASVSRMEITSRPAQQVIGHRVKVEGGKLRSVDQIGCPAGTIVEVKDLFYNVPARRKFLRADKTELDHIINVLSRISLPFRHIHFRLEERDKTILNLPFTENDVNRLSVLMGSNVAKRLVALDQQVGEFKIKAFLAPPDLNRSRGDRIFIYVNNRSIRDRLVTRAVMEGYGQRLMKGRYPQAVIFLEIAPSLVDINVHPTKQEIRFRNGRLVYQTIISAIEDTLGQRFHTVFETPFDQGYEGLREMGEKHLGGVDMAERQGEYLQATGEKSDVSAALFQEPYLVEAGPRVIGQLKDTYILCQTNEGLIMVDQHAAHERVVYESLKRAYGGMQLERQTFLIPHRLEVSLNEGRVIQQRLDQLAKLGLELEHFGGSTFLLRSVPSCLVHAQWENFILDLLSVLAEEDDLSTEKAMDKVLTVMACHGAIRAGKRLSREEMSLLLNQLEGMDLPSNCPHGRPIFKKFSYYEIEKMFKRVV
jgi:DNA mismatch repair protein MutL